MKTGLRKNFRSGTAGEVQESRLNYGLAKFRRWYLGDGTYGDGPHFHWDYYNGYVIHPMLMDILKVYLGKITGSVECTIRCSCGRSAMPQSRNG